MKLIPAFSAHSLKDRSSNSVSDNFSLSLSISFTRLSIDACLDLGVNFPSVAMFINLDPGCAFTPSRSSTT